MNELINYFDFQSKKVKGKKPWAKNCERHLKEERDLLLHGKNKMDK